MYKGSEVQVLQLCCDKNTQHDSLQECELNKDTRAATDNSVVGDQMKQCNDQ